MKENKTESFEETKSRLREELSDLYERYSFDIVKLVVDEDDSHRMERAIKNKTKETLRNI